MSAVQRVAGAGGSLALETWAGGDPSSPQLLLLHGVSRRGCSFAPAVPALVPHFRVHALDQRGHGASDRAGSYLVRDYAADAAHVAARLDGPLVLYGHSLGALVALATAAALPANVVAVVVEDPPGPSFLATVATGDYGAVFELYRRHAGSGLSVGHLARLLADAPLESPRGGARRRFGDIRDAAGIRLTAACLKSLDPAVIDPLLAGRWLEGVDWLGTARSVACPVLLLRADPALGGMLVDADATALVGELADPTVVDFSAGSPWGHAGHNILAQAPDILPRYVIPFLLSTVVGGRGAS